jgi:hypothetical protein
VASPASRSWPLVVSPLHDGSDQDLAAMGPAPTATFVMRGAEIGLVGRDQVREQAVWIRREARPGVRHE